MKKLFLLMAVLMTVIVVIPSCEKEPQPLELPPAESLIIDLSNFPKGETADMKSLPTIGNWLYSSLTVLSWNAVLAVNVAIPVAAYAEAFDQTAVYINDQWEWNYSKIIDERTYVARLVGKRIDNETYTMDMYLSQGNAFTDFKWFSGVIRFDHTEVNWKLSHSPDNPVEYLDIYFEKDYDADSARIRYTVVDPDNQLYESFIEYGENPVNEFDAYYTVNEKNALTYIQWNSETNAGRVAAENYFGDAAWHCWDSQLHDVDCAVESNQLEE